MESGKKILAIIPARGGSKRVPQKNIRLLNGQPLISFAIQAALQTTDVHRVIVSTDDETIAGVARKYGAEVPFMRPASLAKDSTPDQPVLQHTLGWLKENQNYIPDIVLYLRPTSPFKTSKIITEVIQRMLETDANRVCTMTKCNGVHHPYWMYSLSDDGLAKPFIDGIDISNYYQSQLLPPVYRLNGVVDAIKTSAVYNKNYLNEKNMAVVVVSEESAMDIDTEFDFQVCEMLLQKKKNEVTRFS
jgi:CMP-N-acetylneuraminic acid synthetase